MKHPIEPDEKLDTVYTVKDAVQAELIKNLLIDHGIASQVDGDHQAGFTGALEVGILVREADLKQARWVLEQHHVDDEEA